MPCPDEIARFHQDYFGRDDGIGYEIYCDIGKAYWLDYYIFARLKEAGIRPGASILDIGCANGNKVLFYRERGYRAKGIDLSEEATAYGRREHGLDLLRSSIEDYATDERFDAILMLEVIEHIRDPWVWARKVSELLRPGGLVVVTTRTMPFIGR